MTQIKSEKAKAMIDKHWDCVLKGVNLSVGYKVSLAAVILAETEAEERHAKELQALKNKAVEAFDSIIGATNFYNSNNDNFWDLKEQFIQKLNEK